MAASSGTAGGQLPEHSVWWGSGPSQRATTGSLMRRIGPLDTWRTTLVGPRPVTYAQGMPGRVLRRGEPT